MSRLDRHIEAAQARLMLGSFVVGLAWSLLILAGVVWLNVLIDRFLAFHLPRVEMLLLAGFAAAVGAAGIYSRVVRPGDADAALELDRRLGTKEAFSTALYARQIKGDPFADRAVAQAERASDGVSLKGKFPLRFPRVGFLAIAIAGAAGLSLLLPRHDLFARSTVALANKPADPAAVEQAKEQIKRALVAVGQVPQAEKNDEKLALARRDLERAQQLADNNPAAAQRTALQAQQQLRQALKEKIQQNQDFANAMAAQHQLQQLAPPSADEKGPVADARRAMARGDLKAAAENLAKAVQNFDKMDNKDQQAAARQMAQLANQLQQVALDPAAQQSMQQKLQQAGATQQQARQMAAMMQQAASGNPQAQQQLQQMQQQMTQQMNNGQGPTPQQQQQIKSLMQQARAQANAQQQAGTMQQSAQQMAQAMQQAAQAQQIQGNPQEAQAANGQSPQGAQSQPQQANAGGGKPRQQPGGQQQSGKQQADNAQQEMASAQQQMQQQMDDMSATQQDMQQMAAARQSAQDASDSNGQSGPSPGGQGDHQQANNGSPQQQSGGPPGNGKTGGGQGTGTRDVAAAPFTTKTESDPSQRDANGRILASRYIKAPALPGQSTVGLSDVAVPSDQEIADEVDEQRLSGEARKSIKDYFNTLPKGP